MPDMDWDRIFSSLRKAREQLESLKIGQDNGEQTDEPPPSTEDAADSTESTD